MCKRAIELLRFVNLTGIVCVCLSVSPFTLAQEETLGQDILFWSPQQQIIGYRGIDEMFPTREIKRGTYAYPLLPGHRDFSEFRYRHGGNRLSIDDYIRSMNVAGLVAIKDGRILLERYALAGPLAIGHPGVTVDHVNAGAFLPEYQGPDSGNGGGLQ